MAAPQPSPEPDVHDVQAKTGGGFLAAHAVSTSCLGIVNTELKPAPEPQSWYPTLVTNLQAAQNHAQTIWLDDLSTQVTKTIPTQIISYGSTFDAAAQEILELLDEAIKHGSTPKLIGQVLDLLNALTSQLTEIDQELAAISTRLVDFGHVLHSDHHALFDNVNSIQAAIDADNADSENMDSEMKQLRGEIAEWNKQLMNSEIATGAGVFITVVGFALTAATGPVGGVVLAAGILTVAGGAAGWGVWQAKINDAYNKIAAAQAEEDADTQQIIALTGLKTSVSSVAEDLITAQDALVHVREMWGVIAGVLESVIADLQLPNANLPAVVDKTWVLAGRNNWRVLQKFAEDLVEKSVTVQHKSIGAPSAA
jgi:hypothetical protein